jgi:hypothetical protein
MRVYYFKVKNKKEQDRKNYPTDKNPPFGF